MRYVLYCLLAVNYLLIVNWMIAAQSIMGALNSTEEFAIGLAPALFVLLLALGFRTRREPFGYFGIAAIVLALACLVYAMMPAYS